MCNLRMVLVRSAIFGVLTLALGGGAGRAEAKMMEVDTDTSWRVTGTTPGTGWNTNPLYDDSSWSAASLRRNRDLGGVTIQSIWAAPGVNPVWMRKSFTMTGSLASAILYSVIDDDADVYLNGHQIISDHNGVAQYNPPLDVSAWLVQGTNLLAVNIVDNQGGTNGDFGARLVMNVNAVPEPPSCLLLGIGGPLGFWGLRRARSRESRLKRA